VLLKKGSGQTTIHLKKDTAETVGSSLFSIYYRHHPKTSKRIVWEDNKQIEHFFKKTRMNTQLYRRKELTNVTNTFILFSFPNDNFSFFLRIVEDYEWLFNGLYSKFS
jgi:hypothetical protein